jgi:hypothetical protein
MGRAERRARAAEKRKKIVDTLCAAVRQGLERGTPLEQVHKDINEWIADQMAQNPQEKQLYADALAELKAMLRKDKQ